jgi:type IV pilus assembly protein PilE
LNVVSHRGFTLVELMITVAIMAIIAAIALPSYQGYIQSTYFNQAVLDAKACSLAVERYYTNNFTYVGAGSSCNSASPTEGEQKYTISVVSVAATTYAVIAEPVTGSCDDSCVRIALDGTQMVY